jgi:hypothetical protein
MLYYHPLTFQAIKSNNDSCPIEKQKINNKIKIKDKCVVDKNYDFDRYDMFTDVIQVALSDDSFLRQIYNFKNITDVDFFLENDIKELPTLSQIRILNSIYKVYKDNDLFPNKNYLIIVKKILKTYYNVHIKTNDILKTIIHNKYKKKNDNIFDKFIK